MGVDIVFPGPQWTSLETHLFGPLKPDSPSERAEQLAFLLGAPSRSDRGTRLVVRELLLAGDSDLTHQSGAGIAPTGEFVAAALTRCRQEGWSFIEVHSHPFSSGPTTFSGIDWANDRAKMPATAHLLPEGAVHATMVMGPQGLDAHYYDQASSSICPVRRVTIVGAHDEAPWLTRIVPTTAKRDDERPFLVSDRYSRQIPLLGRQAQEILAKSTVVIVGLGGLGSFAAMECAYVGVGNLILIDPDKVDDSNLNRLMGAIETDTDRLKVELFERTVQSISSKIKVKAVADDILSDEAQEAAKQGDLILGCVDKHGARLALNQFAIQHMIPLLDAGTGARLDDDRTLSHAGGQVQAVLPGLGCLECRGFIDVQQAAFDLARPDVKQREIDRGYGTGEPAPSVVFLNGVVASLQVAEAVQLLTGVSPAKQQGRSTVTLYDLLAQSVKRATDLGSTNTCVTCGPDGVGALADLSPLQAAGTLEVTPPPLESISNA
jgi:molybdopterin/thiamine biosynthesis adenylyltransferase